MAAGLEGLDSSRFTGTCWAVLEAATDRGQHELSPEGILDRIVLTACLARDLVHSRVSAQAWESLVARATARSAAGNPPGPARDFATRLREALVAPGADQLDTGHVLVAALSIDSAYLAPAARLISTSGELSGQPWSVAYERLETLLSLRRSNNPEP